MRCRCFQVVPERSPRYFRARPPDAQLTDRVRRRLLHRLPPKTITPEVAADPPERGSPRSKNIARPLEGRRHRVPASHIFFLRRRVIIFVFVLGYVGDCMICTATCGNGVWIGMKMPPIRKRWLGTKARGGWPGVAAGKSSPNTAVPHPGVAAPMIRSTASASPSFRFRINEIIRKTAADFAEKIAKAGFVLFSADRSYYFPMSAVTAADETHILGSGPIEHLRDVLVP